MLQEVAMVKGKRSKRPRSASPLTLTIASTSSSNAVVSDASPSHSSRNDEEEEEEEEDMANCLILLSEGILPPQQPRASAEVYQCKTCSKCFSSFQALGGHRASHKKPNKPTSLEEKKQLSDEDTNLSLQIISHRPVSSGSPRVHECAICGAEFGSGQALGGHMRRHKPIPGVKKARNNVLSLDLNLPAPEDDQPESMFPFAAKEQVIVFAASPLIDCHY
ncbi:hypothetical protein SASPL_111705 [Salvia splendens]|uniref:C2H2-type domain-containing protein n=1 Tax=Salvia splendens TaxID=180675 RepID=A0A8X8YCE9_SALSN|nr:zinc finger protein ZAT5-like [Salvia splendens]KAG6427460.1 hypothetical protein SASPL_111705 [Salvia splendens]